MTFRSSNQWRLETLPPDCFYFHFLYFSLEKKSLVTTENSVLRQDEHLSLMEELGLESRHGGWEVDLRDFGCMRGSFPALEQFQPLCAL